MASAVKPVGLLVGGPPGSGKTAAAEAWASSRDTPTAHLNLDMIRRQLRSGFVDPVVSGWNDAARRRFDLAQDITVLSAKRYHREGIDCVIDDVMFPGVKRARYEVWVEKLGDVPHRLVVLLPSLEVCLQRNSQRQGAKRLPDELIHRFYGDSRHWLDRKDVIIIDNSSLSLEATVIEIDKASNTSL